MLLDVGLPDMDGRDVCRLLRKQGMKAPVIMLTAHSGDADTILGLDSGANDYITKPFRLGVLLARLRAQLRQFELSDDAVFLIGPYSFKPAAKMLVRGDNRKIHLTEKETAILKYLYRVGDRPVSREVLLDEVWGYNAGVTTHTLETHIYRLRQKIEPKPGETTHAGDRARGLSAGALDGHGSFTDGSFGSTQETPDRVTDFSRGQGDKIVAGERVAGERKEDVPGFQTYNFIGNKEFTDIGQLRWYHEGGRTIVAGNTAVKEARTWCSYSTRS